MVFEYIVRKVSDRHPSILFFYALCITPISLFLAYVIFPNLTSILFLFFMTIASVPTFYMFLREEEEVIEKLSGNTKEVIESIFERNKKVIYAYAYFFLGSIVALTFLYTFLPKEYLSLFFKYQINTVDAIRGMAVLRGSDFATIFFNNVKVSFMAFLLSFFFGTGAIFVISWNASIIATFFGSLSREYASNGMCKFFAAIYGLTVGTLSIIIHGIPEILAYFVAGIAGGVLSLGIYKGKFTEEIIKDALLIYSFSVLLLLIAAFLEAYVTPLI